MIWTYRVFCDSQGRYSIREVFYESDGKLVAYGQSPVSAIAASPEELMQLLQWFKEAFELPILSLEEVETRTTTPPNSQNNRSRNVSLNQVIEALDIETNSKREDSKDNAF